MTSFLLPHSSSFLSQLFDQSSYFPFICFLSFILILSHPFFLHNHFPVSHTSSIRSFLPPNSSSFLSNIFVPDRRSRIVPEVVLVRRWAIGVLGIWRGEGLGEGWDKGGQFTSNLRPRWTIPVTTRRVPSK
jgi:hypothetical protein